MDLHHHHHQLFYIIGQCVEQIKIIHLNGFNNDEIESYVPLVRNNVLTNILRIINASMKLSVPFSSEETIRIATELKGLEPSILIATKEFVQRNLGPYIKQLWSDESAKVVG